MLAALSFAEMVVPFRPTTGVTESLVITCLVLPANILVSIATILLASDKIRGGDHAGTLKLPYELSSQA